MEIIFLSYFFNFLIDPLIIKKDRSDRKSLEEKLRLSLSFRPKSVTFVCKDRNAGMVVLKWDMLLSTHAGAMWASETSSNIACSHWRWILSPYTKKKNIVHSDRAKPTSVKTTFALRRRTKIPWRIMSILHEKSTEPTKFPSPLLPLLAYKVTCSIFSWCTE